MQQTVEKLLQPGDRVRISTGYDWAQGATGTIANISDEFREQSPDWRSWYRRVNGRDRSWLTYWVVLDKPQLDADGDGPYAEAAIEEAYLERIG